MDRRILPFGLLLATGCREVLGLEEPRLRDAAFHDAIDDARIDAALDAPPDAPPDAREGVLTFTVSCPTGPRSADQLCITAGYARAALAHGHYWWQCAGTGDRCPGGWQVDGLSCLDWCGGTDCVSAPFCGGSESVHERAGDGATQFDPLDFGSNCAGNNPGWTVRARCVD